MIIPNVALEQTTIEEEELDTSTVDPVRRGVNFILRLAPADATPRMTSLNFTNVPARRGGEGSGGQTGLRQRN